MLMAIGSPRFLKTASFCSRHTEVVLSRENLYDMLSKEGNPRLSSLTTILSQLGMELSFKPKMQGTEAA